MELFRVKKYCFIDYQQGLNFKVNSGKKKKRNCLNLKLEINNFLIYIYKIYDKTKKSFREYK